MFRKLAPAFLAVFACASGTAHAITFELGDGVFPQTTFALTGTIFTFLLGTGLTYLSLRRRRASLQR